jgi:Bacteriophage abortive infection AbiH
MNRLILIGNGFDLAHGLKTSYNDFILWYMKQCFTDAFHKGEYTDELIHITIDYQNNAYPLSDIDSVHNLIDRFYEVGFKDLILNRPFKTANQYQYASPYKVTKVSYLLRSLLNNCSYARWVDIENEFYEELKRILLGHLTPSEKEERLINVNQSLKALINQLENYLKTLKAPDYIQDYMHILTSKIKHTDVHDIALTDDKEPESTLILNFNYTNTIQQYLDWFGNNSSQPTPTLNFIHGRISLNTNPIIFGFGDELDDAYLLMEREKIKGYFEYVKSFWYFKTSNYRNLVTFIDSNAYQVCILGHSCGLSDRTMLHMIFEHTNCKSIKIYYYESEDGQKNYTPLTHEIARHFTDKAEMRNKIVSLDRSSSMPQKE